jgi:HTH-type transcriptional regulator, cell division transcriptional repressor
MGLRVKDEPWIEPSRVRRARVEAGLSQEDLARKIGCSRRAVQFWESESPSGRRPHARLIRKLAEATGKPVAWFFAPEEDAA